MNKKKILTTLSIAAVAIVSGYGGMKAYQPHANDLGLLIQDVEALSQPDNHSGFSKICQLPADPIWCSRHYEFKWTYTKDEPVGGKCICVAKQHDCCAKLIR